MSITQHYLLYGHGGSYNHGGEAIVSTTIKLLREISPSCRITLSTHFVEQDIYFSVDADEFIERDITGKTNEEVYSSTLNSITSETICIHLGGDNFCYRNWQRYAEIHSMALQRGARSILWSCSIEPDAIDDEMLNILKGHHLITAREEITYRALIGYGLSNVRKVSDIAFLLKAVPVEFSTKDFTAGNFVAVNFSPLVIRRNVILKSAMQRLVDYILKETDMNIVLIPHVLAAVDNDYEALSQIRICDTQRAVLISDKLSAGQYKYIISKAQFGVFSRTHAAIAAYASKVPTLVIGYSCKAEGIALDLNMSDYVLDAACISDEEDVVKAFQCLMNNKEEIKKRLADRIPYYIKSAVNKEVLQFLTASREQEE